ncbi:MAG: hypothetical protein PHE24_02190 [Patescibacteria group bacterium]|nr:hypothetical protein [Patescibacteria group bacterium]
MIPGAGGKSVPVVGIVVTGFEEFEGVVVAGDSLRMTLKIQKDDGEQVTVYLMPEINKLGGKSGKEGTSSFLDIIKGAYDLGIDMPYKIGKLASDGYRVRVTNQGMKILKKKE